MMLEQSDGTYKESTSSSFPIDMVFNTEKSGCIDNSGNKLENSIIYSNGIVNVETNSTIYCYVYFDRNDVVSIAVTTPPTKTQYEPGEIFDPTGMIITATYIDGTTNIVTNYTITNGDKLSEDMTTVTISYTENGVTKTTTYEVVFVSVPVITIKRHSTVTGSNSTYANVTINGVVYDGSQEVALSLPIGTNIACYIGGPICTYTVYDKDGNVKDRNELLTKGTYYYEVVGNATIEVGAKNQQYVGWQTEVIITET